MDVTYPHTSRHDLSLIADWIIEGFRVNELGVDDDVVHHVERCDECAGAVASLVVQQKLNHVEDQRIRIAASRGQV
jgi:hypothetical protein